jgi:CHASE2 domain-containing sensor protein
MVAVTVLAGAVGYAIWHTNTGRNLELKSVDTRFVARGGDRAWPGVVVVGIDDPTVETGAFGRAPFARRWDAKMIDTLRRDGARAIAFDLVFDTRTDNADDLALYQAAARTRGRLVLAGGATNDRGQTFVLGGVANQRAAGIHVGSAYFPEDTDGSVRRVPRQIERLRSFSAATALAAGLPPTTLADEFANGPVWVDFPGGAGTVPTYSFAAVLHKGLPRSQWVSAGALRGKIVVVGATAADLQDTHTVGGWTAAPMSGPEIEADAISTLMRGAPLRPTSTALDWLAIVLAALVLPVLAAIRVRWPRLIAAAVAVAVIMLVSAQLAFDGGTIVLLIAPLSALIVAGTFAVLIPLGFERRELIQLRALRDRFARFDPSVVDAVLSDPGAALRVRAMALGPESVIAGYRLVSLIGRGGMGVVYEAVQLTLNRPVALKLIDPARINDEELRARFVRESHVAAGLEHPHVIPVYEAREDDGLLFIAMRLVLGPSLHDVLASQAPLPPARAATIVAQIASALGAAHAKGLVHRDVKPANVLLHDGEHAYLTDFGITREISDTSLTAAGARIGTVDYMSPEQCRGELVGPASDLYALGCVLYEALTGRVPFAEGGEAMKLAAHLNDAPPIASRHWPSVPHELDLVILTALAKDPGQRHASAEAFAAAVLHAAGVEAVPPPEQPHPPAARIGADQATIASG